jgi:hypothetical protein
VLILAVLATLQAVGPVLPFGVNRETHLAFLGAQESLSKGDVAGAKTFASLLPSREISFEWDGSLGPDAATMRDRAIEEWIGSVPGLKFKPVAKGGVLKFVFAEKGPGAELVFGDSPRLVVTIAKKRNGDPIQPAVVYNEVAFGIGSYLGLAPTPLFGSFMGRTEINTSRRTSLSSRESLIARQTLSAVATLRQLVQAGRPVTPARPQLEMSNDALGQTELNQGAKVSYKVAVRNSGNAPLVIQASPDCGCVAVTPITNLNPGEAGTLDVTIDTTEQRGRFRHRLIILTNAADRSSETIPLELDIRPRYRLVGSIGNLALLDSSADQYKVKLWWNGDPFEVLDAAIEGFEGTISVAPWTGDSPDPELNESTLDRKGYELTISADGDVAQGRNPATLVVKTSDKAFPELRYSFFIQRGIAVLPAQVSFGESSGERTGRVVLSCPGKPFKVLSVASDHSNVSGKLEGEGALAEHKILVRYDGKASTGDLSAVITVTTDNPSQPTLRIPVRVRVP